MARNSTTICVPKDLEGDLELVKIDHDGILDGYEFWYCGVKVLWIDNPYALEIAQAILEAESEERWKPY